MTGVSVDTGPAAPTPTDLDFRAIFEGGDNFMARAKMLSELRAQHDVAFATLKVGQDARKALDEAQKSKQDAGARLDQANRELAQAQATGAELVQKAKDQAADILKNAQDGARQIMEQAQRTKDDADWYAGDKRSAADTALRNARESEAATTAANQAAVAALKEHQDAKAAFQDAKAKADAFKQEIDDKVAALRHTIGQLFS
jgi:hypothetical protein